VVSPIGIGRDAVWESFRAGRSGVGRFTLFDPSGLPVQIAGQVSGFDPKAYVKPRKALKVMARDAQLGVAASVLAVEDGGLESGSVDPDRMGVVLGADRICGEVFDSIESYRRCIVDGAFDFSRWFPKGMEVAFPLSFLKVLPNMIASHISIAHDARGPNNTIHHAELSSLLAMAEACRVIQRGAADVMIAGGASSTMNPFDWAVHCVTGRLSTSRGDPSTVMRPFDADRDGEVQGEGSAAFILERRDHAEARGASILATVLGWGAACEISSRRGSEGASLERAIGLALEGARLGPGQIGHVNAHGVSCVVEDETEALAIREVLPDVPVTAPKSYFGNLLAAGGAVETAATLVAFETGLVPPTLNYERPDPKCPIPVVAGAPRQSAAKTAVLVNRSRIGQAVAMVLGGSS
jgi:3-oxoacyl-[acyl-carrier-protein] synthase II